MPVETHALEGYASATSVNKGESIDLFINTDPAANGELQVFRMGWYGDSQGNNPVGARAVTDIIPFQGRKEVIPQPSTDTGLVECQWQKTIPLDTSLFSGPPDGLGPVSGYYLVKLSIPTAAKPTAQSYIIFVLREDQRGSQFLMNAAMTTYQAYNGWGGQSLYTRIPAHPDQNTTQVSFDRPYGFNFGASYFLDYEPNQYSTTFPDKGWEYQMVRFLEREGYDVTYATDIDLHKTPGLLTNPNYSKGAFLSVGHDEYWSMNMHDNLRTARDMGKHIAFFSGNSVFWIINILSSTRGNEFRILQTFKDNTPANPWLWQNCALTGGSQSAPRCTMGEESEQTLVGSITTDGYEDRGDLQFNAEDFVVNQQMPDWVPQMLQDSGLHAGSRIPGIIGHESQTV
jgi:hypothetical protein